MSTDPPRPGDPPAEEPTVIGSGLRPVEDRLRRALGADAASITPTDRLGAILREARASEQAGSGSAGRHRWLAPAAAAAAAVLVAGTIWALNRPPTEAPTVPVASTEVSTPTPSSAVPEPSTEVSTPTPSRSSVGPSGAPSSVATGPAPTPTTAVTTSPTPPAASPISLPVYYLGPIVTGSDQVRLFREFVSTTTAGPSVPDAKGLAALRLAMAPAPSSSSYRSAWTGVTAESVTFGSTAITVRLSSGTRDPSSLAAEQLVWTVQAAVGTTLPVRFELADGGPTVSPGHPVASTYSRPTAQIAVLEQVAPIWVDDPARGGVVRAGHPLKVTGLASTFEANLEWEVLRDGTRVDVGSTTASAAAPARGSYTFTTTKPLGAGAYLLRVFASSAKDGATVAEQTVPVTAR